jgi:GxxExxY protein
MPATVRAELRRVDEGEFADAAYVVMGHVFEIHREFGRFFDERIYKQELARRVPGVELEVPVDVTFESFHTTYFIDAVVGGCAVFEFKAAESLTNRHRAQVLNYLLLCELEHAKLINVRPTAVEHEFVNTSLKTADRVRFQTNAASWTEFGNHGVRDWFRALLADLGTGLDVGLYEEALSQRLGGRPHVEQPVEIISGEDSIGWQRFRLVQPDVAFKITTLSHDLQSFEIHSRRMLAHTRLKAIQWINVDHDEVRFHTLTK